LRELEHRFPNELAVVGVHSGKYIAERETARIREAAIRLGVTHPIVNDRQFRVWRAYAVRAWPTLVVVDPDGYAVVSHAGEFTSAMVAPVVERLIEAADAAGVLRRGADELPPPDPPAIPPGTLRYPGKVALDASRDRIAVADTAHHRVLVGTLADGGRRMRVEHVVGSGTAGLRDAEQGGAAAQLALPNGIAFARTPSGGETLYVADTGNHAVRAVDLATGAVRTLAGTGRRLRTRADLAAGAMASPWDLAVLGSTLYVAMAGAHQIWEIDLATGERRVHAGQGGEDIRDGALQDALLAQPMGLSAAVDAGRLYVADAESSAVRWADLDPGGAVGTVVGTGLFDFGDADGAGDAVRMQHQQGLAVHESGRLLVADSYNDALKWVDPTTRRVESWIRGLHEPGGLALGRGLVYVADTNAHRVAIVSETTGEIADLVIEGEGLSPEP